MGYSLYDFTETLARIGQVKDRTGEDYRKYAFFPEKDELKQCKGAYVDGIAIASRLVFVARDIDLLTIAKVYEMFLTEARAIMTVTSAFRDVSVDGHIFRGLYNIENDDFFNEVLDIAGRLISLSDVINTKLGRRNNPIITSMCAIDFGTMFVANVDDNLIYSGNMCTRIEGYIIKPLKEEVKKGIFITEKFYGKLKDDYKAFFNKVVEESKVYYGSVENIGMSRWVKEQE